MGLFSIVTCKKYPIMRWALTGMCQVIIKRRNDQLKGQFHCPIIFIHLNKRYGSFEGLLEAADRNIFFIAVERFTEACIPYYIFRVFCAKRRCMISANIRELDDLFCFES